MKIRAALALLAVCALSFLLFRAEPETKISAAESFDFADLQPQSFRARAFAATPKLSDLIAESKNTRSLKKIADGSKVLTVADNLPARKRAENAAHDAESSFAAVASRQMPDAALSFEGIKNRNNGETYDLFFLPSDTNGDAGLNHYVQAVNALVRIYDKNGSALTPPFKMSSIFAPLNTICADRNDGEPIVLYDPLADRWLISQYCNAFPPFRQLIAVSQTGDPTGTYFVYEFVMPNIKLNDYAKFGVWRDGFYMSSEQFIGGDFAGIGVFAFDRAKMLAGDASAGFIYFDLPAASTTRLGNLLPADLDGLNPSGAGVPNTFVGYSATEYGDAQDAIRLFDFRTDFQNPSNSSFTERAESPLAVAPFDPTSPDGRADIAQPAPGERLDAQSDRIMYRSTYRNFGAHESLVFNQTVRTSPPGGIYRAGVRVYELRKTGDSFAVHEQATIGDETNSRWMAAAAQDHEGNLAVGYSLSSEEIKPAIYYSGRLATEPNGVFRTENALVKGTGVQTAFGFRWGNYTGMTVDPSDDCTFWLTNQYYSAESQAESPFSWLTRIGTFKFDECTPAPQAAITGTVRNAANGQPIKGALVSASAYSRNSGASGNYGNLRVLPGEYRVTVSAKGYLSQSVTVSAPDGQILVQNFALEPVPVLEFSGTVITSESCALNQAIEPGETVTLSVSLRNSGARATQNLSANLLATGGVTSPSAAQNYGALAANGAAARPFTFTASPNLLCGNPVTLTFALFDGAENLGPISIKLNMGARRIALRENFDAVTAPELPAGWTTSAAGAQQNWTTSTVRNFSAPNSVFSPDPNQIGVNELVSPEFAVNSARAELAFKNWYELETTFLRNRLYDGAVLEIKIGAGDWQDIETAGGEFLAGGYDGVLESNFQNPLGGRRAWSGRSGIDQAPEFITSRVRLPAAAAKKRVRLRFRVGTDRGTFREGQYIDDLTVADEYVCACRNAPRKTAPFDFDGDGRTDLSIFRPADAAGESDFYVLKSSDNELLTAAWGGAGDLPVNADYDGDGQTDFAVFRPSDKNWYLLKSADSTVSVINFGLAGDISTPADFDGDGRADIAVFRPADGVWYFLRSSDNRFTARAFGAFGDVPVQADYDGDGRADFAVFRPSNGTWYILQSSDEAFISARFGQNGDRPVSGDFDGDGRGDLTVFRPSNGNWYSQQSSEGFAAVNFGLAADKVLQADFDGDGRRDIAVFRADAAAWYYLKSSDKSFAFAAFGANGDTPLPSIYLNH